MSKSRDENIPNVFYLKTCVQQDYNNTHTLCIFLLYQAVGGKFL